VEPESDQEESEEEKDSESYDSEEPVDSPLLKYEDSDA